MTSNLEDLLAWQLAATGLPTPEREHRILPPRRWRTDFAWPALMLAVEVEGGIFTGGRHTSPTGFAKDIEKYNALTLAGWKLLRVTGGMVKDGTALNLVERAIGLVMADG